ncbi:MAG: metallophosphoesterase family protein [Armatimonadetes bacterium]|nr:metallophosphoesterase family protein [Armatimonadota bacterium]
MRYGIVSDIHGNLQALEAVAERLSADRVDAYLCLGDVVGYGADPNACCERVRSLPGLRVVGNHDRAAIGAFDLQWFNDHARAALEWTARVLTPENREFLAALPETASGSAFLLAHGSPANPVAGYIMDAFGATAGLDVRREPLCFVGHTHVPGAFARPRGRRLCARLDFRPGQPLALAPDCECLVNCGAVGQSRDGNPDAACGVYDTESGTVACLRVPYDVGAAQARIHAAGLPAWLADRLAPGR